MAGYISRNLIWTPLRVFVVLMVGLAAITLLAAPPAHAVEKTYSIENLNETIGPGESVVEAYVDVPDDINVESLRISLDIFAPYLYESRIQLFHPDGTWIYLNRDLCAQAVGGSLFVNPLSFGERNYIGDPEPGVDVPEATAGTSETYTWQDGGAKIRAACDDTYAASPTGWGDEWPTPPEDDGSWSKIGSNTFAPEGEVQRSDGTRVFNQTDFSEFYGKSAKGYWYAEIVHQGDAGDSSFPWGGKTNSPIQLNAISLTFEYDDSPVTITADPTTIIADGISTSTITVQLTDGFGNNLTSTGGVVELSFGTGSGTLSAVTDNLDGTYSATLTSSTIAEIVTITGTLAGEPIEDDATVEYIDPFDVAAHTSRVIRNFMADRADQIIANDINLAERLTNRGGANSHYPISMNGRELFLGALGGLGVQGQGVPDGLQSAYVKTSLNQVKAFKQRLDDGQEFGLGADTGVENYDNQSPVAQGKFDIWFEGRYIQVNQDGREGDMGLFRVGADYLINSDLLFGVMGQVDVFDQNIDALDASVDGDGFMVGPYIVGRLGDNLIYEGRGLWGRSDNNVNPLGTYTDNFQTERWMVKGAVTGDFSAGPWKFAPAVSAYYFEETQELYIDTLGNTIEEQMIDLGRLAFGPKISFDRALSDEIVMTPHIKLQGIWDFNPSDQVDLDGVAVYSTGEVRARIEAGVDLSVLTGGSLSLSGFYDGLGTDTLEAYGGMIRLYIPFGADGPVIIPTPAAVAEAGGG